MNPNLELKQVSNPFFYCFSVKNNLNFKNLIKNSRFVVSELVVGSGEQDMFMELIHL